MRSLVSIDFSRHVIQLSLIWDICKFKIKWVFKKNKLQNRANESSFNSVVIFIFYFGMC